MRCDGKKWHWATIKIDPIGENIEQNYLNKACSRNLKGTKKVDAK
jgi:hypothetical protein